MSNTATFPVHPSARTSCPRSEGVVRMPFYFESQHQWIFAWLHRREHASHAEHGVIICSPIGHEQVHAHRSLRHLADALAEAGFPVVRPDYHGTGDSAGSDEDPERVAAWLANIRDARSWLTDQLGCTRITLIGLRLGATFAVQAAVSQAVDGLLLWAPLVQGRSYVREMKALSLTAGSALPPSAETPKGIEAGGFVLTEQTAQELSRLDLRLCRPLCRRALIITREEDPTDTQLLEYFTTLGIEAEQTAQPGYGDMMTEPHCNKVPREAIGRTVDWMLAAPLAGDETGEEFHANSGRQAAAPPPHSAGYAVHSQQRIRECVLHISQQPNLFGIVSELPEAVADHLPFVVLVNAGSSYRVGPNRLYVSLARQLAARGFRCLRMDLCGLGDSVTPNSERENDPYPATAFRDIKLTLDCLQTKYGVRRVVLMGLCSGAYAAFQAAAQLSDPLLVESVLINPLTYFWGEGSSLEASPALQLKSFQETIACVWQPRKWLKLLSGKSKMGIAGAIKMLMERWRLHRPSGNKSPVGGRDASPGGFPLHPLRDDLPGDLERVEKAGRHLTCFFARSDPGYGILTLYARRKVKELLGAGKMSVHFISDADHTFSRQAPRRALAQVITEHLGRRYLQPAK